MMINLNVIMMKQLEDKDPADRHSVLKIVFSCNASIVTNLDRKEKGDMVFTELLRTLFIII